jgi:hypothetical protein
MNNDNNTIEYTINTNSESGNLKEKIRKMLKPNIRLISYEKRILDTDRNLRTINTTINIDAIPEQNQIKPI